MLIELTYRVFSFLRALSLLCFAFTVSTGCKMTPLCKTQTRLGFFSIPESVSGKRTRLCGICREIFRLIISKRGKVACVYATIIKLRRPVTKFVQYAANTIQCTFRLDLSIFISLCIFVSNKASRLAHWMLHVPIMAPGLKMSSKSSLHPHPQPQNFYF